MEILHFLFGIFGNAAALFLFLAPVITFRRILRSKSTEQFSGVPYTMTLLNCLLSAWYGLPFVSPHNILVSTINFTGAAIVYAAKKARTKMLVLLGLLVTVFTLVVLVSLFALHGQGRKLFCGFAAAIFSICMYAAPLAIMRHVIKTKSVEFMPFFLSLFVFLCGASWFVYVVLGRDLFVAVPNGFGCALGALQLILYVVANKIASGMVYGTICIIVFSPVFGVLIGTDSRGNVRDCTSSEIVSIKDCYRKFGVLGQFYIVFCGNLSAAVHVIGLAEEKIKGHSVEELNIWKIGNLLLKGMEETQKEYPDANITFVVGSVEVGDRGFICQELVYLNSGTGMKTLKGDTIVSVNGSGSQTLGDLKSKKLWRYLSLYEAKRLLITGIVRAMEADELCGGAIEMVSLRPVNGELAEESCLVMPKDLCKDV